MLKFARDHKVPIGFKDLGAGGIACAFSEMPEASGFGADLDLDKVNKALRESASRSDLVLGDAGALRDRGADARERRTSLISSTRRFEMPKLYAGARRGHHRPRLDEQSLRDASTADGWCATPRWPPSRPGIAYRREAKSASVTLPDRPGMTHAARRANGVRDALLGLPGSINICDKSTVFQHYDSEVQGPRRCCAPAKPTHAWRCSCRQRRWRSPRPSAATRASARWIRISAARGRCSKRRVVSRAWSAAALHHRLFELWRSGRSRACSTNSSKRCAASAMPAAP